MARRYCAGKKKTGASGSPENARIQAKKREPKTHLDQLVVPPAKYIARIGTHPKVHTTTISVIGAHKIVRCPVTAMAMKCRPVEVVVAVPGQSTDEILERSYMPVVSVMIPRTIVVMAILVVMSAMPVRLMPAAIVIVTTMVVAAVMNKSDSTIGINR